MPHKLPKVVIVGRPNVGKSSLFNKIAGTRRAIVESSCGTTRDRLHANITWKDKRFTLVDTGGFEPAKKGDMASLVLKQLESGIKEADILLFVVDGSEGLLHQDMDLTSILRKTSKRIFLVVNKMDDGGKASGALDFFELGLGNPYPVSALNSVGIEPLLNDLAGYIADPVSAPETRAIGVAIVGRPNVGKSSYINAILNEERVIVHPVAGTTRDAIDIDFNYNGIDYLLIDTAGMRHNAKINEPADFFSTVRSKEAVKRADVAIVMIDGFEGLKEDDERIINFILKEGKGLVLAVNKSDLINNEAMRSYNELLLKKMSALRNFPVIFISCKTKRNVIKILDIVKSVYEKSVTSLKEEDLKKILEVLTASMEIKSKRITVLDIKQEGIMPLRLVIAIKSAESLTNHMKRYIENLIRNTHDFSGIPLEIRFSGKLRRKDE